MKNYKINFVTDTVTVTKKFLKAAEVIGSTEYVILRELRKDGMQIVLPPQRRISSNHQPTYAKMEKYIANCENSEQHLKDFETIKETKSYTTVWKWFTETFPAYSKTQC